MPCYHPLKGFIIGTTENGKRKLKVTSYDVDSVKYFNSDYGFEVFTDEYIEIPCGQCIGCRLDYSRHWAVRCMLEAKYHKYNYFVTLTYDDDNLPYGFDDDGVVTYPSLNKRDYVLFFKKLRQALKRSRRDGFRYFLCGEYGTKTHRPHYHFIAFGLELDDLVLWKKLPNGHSLYNSKFLTDVWGKGHVAVGDVTFESCAYVARYIVKKQKGQASSVYDEKCIVPEFSTMSRKPGIGKDYFDEHFRDIYPNDYIVLDGGKLVTPPRYFDKLMDSFDESLNFDDSEIDFDSLFDDDIDTQAVIESVKANRLEKAELNKQFKLNHTSDDYIGMLESEERNLLSRTKKLVRPLE